MTGNLSEVIKLFIVQNITLYFIGRGGKERFIDREGLAQVDGSTT